MKDNTKTNTLLNDLVEAFKADSDGYQDLETPKDSEGKRRILRSLMNIRRPGLMSEAVVHIQDEYLRERTQEKGIVTLSDIPEIQASISLWQGDITRLAVDAIVNAANSQMLGCFISMRIPTELIPKCPDDGSDVVMNLRSDDSFVEDEGWGKASAAYSDFLYRHSKNHVLYLELGVGSNTPVIIKYPFWQMSSVNPAAVYACLNYEEAYCPEKIEKQSICIDGDTGEVLEQLL